MNKSFSLTETTKSIDAVFEHAKVKSKNPRTLAVNFFANKNFFGKFYPKEEEKDDSKAYKKIPVRKKNL